MSRETREVLRWVILTLIFCLFFIVLTPALVKLLHEMWGKILYGFLLFCALVLAFRLRAIFRKLEGADVSTHKERLNMR